MRDLNGVEQTNKPKRELREWPGYSPDCPDDSRRTQGHQAGETEKRHC